ncbi:MAG: Xaa-Pro dipeptidase [Acidobacteriota bacterium]
MTDGRHYPSHLEILDRALGEALEHAGRQGVKLDGVLFHAGSLETYHRDDRVVIFQPTAHFRRWVPALEGPEHVVLARPGSKPLVVRVSPTDYWYDTAPQPESYWESSVELAEVASFDEVSGVIGGVERLAYVGSSLRSAEVIGIPADRVEPEALMAPLDWHRAYKTEHEIALTRRAAESAAAGHRRAREVFEAGGSEREIHFAYLAASDRLEWEIPYETIIAFNEKGAILHYQLKRGGEVAPGRSLLIDAGSSFEGYAIDVTRTWASADAHPVFRELVKGVDSYERDLVALVTSGRPYLEIHVEAHRATARLLSELGILRVNAEEAFDRGLTRPFLPHGVGHQMGLQVHDVGGHQAGPEGGTIAPPEEYPFLRNTRIIEPGHLLTIEPGIYFNPTLLYPLQKESEGKAMDWDLVEQMMPLGGIRIEDNVVCREAGPEDLTRELIPGP